MGFCKKIKDLGFLVKLDTNGSRPEVIRDLLDANLIDYIAMDVKHTWEQYADLVWKDIKTELYQESIKLIMDHCPDYEFRTTVIKWVHTSDDIEKIAQNISWARKYFQGDSFSLLELESLQQIAMKHVQKCQIRN